MNTRSWERGGGFDRASLGYSYIHQWKLEMMASCHFSLEVLTYLSIPHLFPSTSASHPIKSTPSCL
jgi:hypothetical protein